MIILDASVVIKWFSEEEYTEKALGLRERIRYEKNK
jgi:predicted nucleic acid-binding protein